MAVPGQLQQESLQDSISTEKAGPGGASVVPLEK
jgi:hypothetical protein